MTATTHPRPVFQFPEVSTAHLTHFQAPKEQHGDRAVMRVDIRLRRDAPAEQLALLAPGLREALYWNAAEQGKEQERLPDFIAVLPDLLFPELFAGKAYKWNAGLHVGGYRFLLDYGVGDDKSNIDLSECKCTNWSFEAKANGLSSLWWTVQCIGEQVTDRVLALLPRLVDTDVHFQLFAPPVYALVKGNKKPATPPANPGQQELGDGDDTPEGGDSHDPLDPASPEGAMAAAGEAAP